MNVSKKVFLTTLARELHKPVRHVFPTQRVYSDGKDFTWGIDLAHMGTWKAANDGYTFILTVIDVYTRWLMRDPSKQNRQAKC